LGLEVSEGFNNSGDIPAKHMREPFTDVIKSMLSGFRFP
jgi:hypothetical protein